MSLVRDLSRRVRDFVNAPVLERLAAIPPGLESVTQIQLMLEYRACLAQGRPLPSLRDVGFQCQSQADEDGILLFLFAVIGTTNKQAVEICAGDGIECNSANLILNHGWHALLVDGDERKVGRGRRFFARARPTSVFSPRYAHAWITRSGVNELVAGNGFSGPIDLLSLDLDGVDYWIWDALTVVEPRVVVVEYQDTLGPDRSWTVPYSDTFSARDYPMTGGLPNFCSASLRAFTNLARRKGYRLVGVNRYGFNAFFVKNGLGDDVLPEIDVRECFGHPKVVWGMRERFPVIKDAPWVEV